MSWPGRSLAVRLGGFACRRLLDPEPFRALAARRLRSSVLVAGTAPQSRLPGSAGDISTATCAATLAAAREAGVDGVVCGHIHRAALTEVDGLLYCNDGDSVESCTALIEDQLGELSLLEWRPTAATIAAAAVSISAWAHTITTVEAEQEAA